MGFIKKAIFVSMMAFALSACGTTGAFQIANATESRMSQAIAWPNGNINGGEWVGSSKKLHPDFLWMPTIKSDTAVAADAWDGSDGIKWTDVKMLLEKSLE